MTYGHGGLRAEVRGHGDEEELHHDHAGRPDMDGLCRGGRGHVTESARAHNSKQLLLKFAGIVTAVLDCWPS